MPDNNRNSYQSRRKDLFAAAALLIGILFLALCQLNTADRNGTPAPPHWGGVFIALDNLTKAAVMGQPGSRPMLLRELKKINFFREAELWERCFKAHYAKGGR